MKFWACGKMSWSQGQAKPPLSQEDLPGTTVHIQFTHVVPELVQGSSRFLYDQGTG